MRQLFAGDEFAGYRIERELGRGGMGIVYLAEQISLRRRVALKILTPQFAAEPDFQARFEREARYAAAIDHRNVVPIYAADSHRGLPYLAMRYIEGTDLRRLLAERGLLGAGLAAHVVAEVARALDAAHSEGLVHRDVKPANVLLAGEDAKLEVYLTDFGLTKDAGSQSGALTNSGQWVGTLNYVAPEQLQGERIDARTDIYSLACVLFEALSGRLPYEGPDARKMWGHANEPPPALADTEVAIGRRFDPVLSRAMAKDPGGRYPSAGDFGRAVLAAARGEVMSGPERTVATGAAAVGLPAGEAPTGTGATHPLQPSYPREPVASAPSRRPAGTEPQHPTGEAPRRRARRTWLVAAVGVVAVALAAAGGLLLASSTRERRSDADGAPNRTAPTAGGQQTEAAPSPTTARPEPAPTAGGQQTEAAPSPTTARPEPEPAPTASPPAPLGAWSGSALQDSPTGARKTVRIDLTITGLDSQAAGRLRGQQPSGSSCGGSLAFVARRGRAFTFTLTETENVAGCVDETSVTVSRTGDRELSYLETWQTEDGQGTVRGTLSSR